MKPLLQTRRAIALFALVLLAGISLWQGFHHHDAENSTQVEASCVFCKVAPQMEQGLGSQNTSSLPNVPLILHLFSSLESVFTISSDRSLPIRAPPISA